MAILKLGARGRDSVTGFRGTVTTDARYLGGARSFRLEAANPDPTKEPLSQWVDKGRLEADEIVTSEAAMPLPGERLGEDE